MKITEGTSQKIKNMSLLCAAFVVSIHIGLPGELGASTWLLHQLTVDGISRIAVPFFFLVSGFFLAGHIGENEWWKKEVLKRIPSLVIPFFFWSFICIASSIPLSIIADIISHRPFGTSIYVAHADNWLRIFGFDMTDYPILVPLWYVRCLFFFVLVSPLVAAGVRRFRYLWLAGCFVLMLLHTHIPNEGLRDILRFIGFGNGIFYFSCGIFIQKNELPRTTTKVAATCGLVGLALLAAKTILAYNSLPFQISIGKLFIPFLMLAVWHYMPATRIPAWLASCSFPIFLMHPIIMSNVSIVLKNLHICPSGSATQSAFNFIFGISGSIFVAVLLRRLTPHATKVLFGGR